MRDALAQHARNYKFYYRVCVCHLAVLHFLPVYSLFKKDYSKY